MKEAEHKSSRHIVPFLWRSQKDKTNPWLTEWGQHLPAQKWICDFWGCSISCPGCTVWNFFWSYAFMICAFLYGGHISSGAEREPTAFLESIMVKPSTNPQPASRQTGWLHSPCPARTSGIWLWSARSGQGPDSWTQERETPEFRHQKALWRSPLVCILAQASAFSLKYYIVNILDFSGQSPTTYIVLLFYLFTYIEWLIDWLIHAYNSFNI